MWQNFDVHHFATANYIITISYMKFHRLNTKIWMKKNNIDIKAIKGQ